MNAPNSMATAIFIAGNSRSGTTMMSKILGKNPAVFSFNELHFFEQLWYPQEHIPDINMQQAITYFSGLISLQREGYLADRNPEQFRAEAAKHLAELPTTNLNPPFVFMNFLRYESALHGKRIPCEQTPRNLFFIDEILHYYPGAKIICMVRDPRDVLLSQKFKWKRRFLGHHDMPMKEVIRSWFNYHPVTISKLWNSSAKKIISSLDKNEVRLVKFEELISRPEPVMRDLCSFLGIDFHESMLLIPNEGSSVVADTGSVGIDKTKTGNFLSGGLTKTEIYLCQKITAAFRKRFGYEDVKADVGILSTTVAYISFPVKLSVALLLNLKRTKNLVNSIKRRFA